MNDVLIVGLGGGKHAEKVVAQIQRKGSFTKTLTVSETSPKRADLAMISLNGNEIDYFAICLSGRETATDQKVVQFISITPTTGIGRQLVLDKMAPRNRDRLASFRDGVYRATEAVGKDMLKAITELYPDVNPVLASLRANVTAMRSRSALDWDANYVFERDAVGTALEAWRGRVLRTRILREAPGPTGDAPFLSGLANVPVGEDIQINHDFMNYPNMEVVQQYQYGAIQFEANGDRLTIVNCNHQPLERALGVDLIFLHHTFNSFVMVQYKRLTGSGRNPVYRPDADAHHAAELQRMKSVTESLREMSRGTSVNETRLSNDPFYFKLCDARVSHPKDPGLLPGMYIPLEMWNRFLACPDAKGPRGGTYVGWDNCVRRFSTSEFTNLLSRGWIGTSGKRTEVLSSLIAEILKGNRQLVYAVADRLSQSKDLRRDSKGKFTATGDLTGST
jgi:hypothetical protein